MTLVVGGSLERKEKMVSIKEEKLHETRNVVLGDTEENNVLCVDMSVPNANKKPSRARWLRQR